MILVDAHSQGPLTHTFTRSAIEKSTLVKQSIDARVKEKVSLSVGIIHDQIWPKSRNSIPPQLSLQ